MNQDFCSTVLNGKWPNLQLLSKSLEPRNLGRIELKLKSKPRPSLVKFGQYKFLNGQVRQVTLPVFLMLGCGFRNHFSLFFTAWRHFMSQWIKSFFLAKSNTVRERKNHFANLYICWRLKKWKRNLALFFFRRLSSSPEFLHTKVRS